MQADVERLMARLMTDRALRERFVTDPLGVARDSGLSPAEAEEIGKRNGKLSTVRPDDLLAETLKALVTRTGVDPAEVEDVVIGCVDQLGEQGLNIARNAALIGGFPLDVCGTTLDRMCGSGQQAANFAAMGVMSGQQDLVIGGGVESMSRVPMGADQSGLDGHNRHLRELHPLVPQGVSAVGD